MAAKALPITRKVEIINKKEFATAVSNVENETFMVYIAALAELTIILIYSSCQV